MLAAMLAVGQSQHKVSDAVLAASLLLCVGGHVSVIQLDHLLLQRSRGGDSRMTRRQGY